MVLLNLLLLVGMVGSAVIHLAQVRPPAPQTGEAGVVQGSLPKRSCCCSPCKIGEPTARAGMLSCQLLSHCRTELVPAPGSVGPREEQCYVMRKSPGFRPHLGWGPGQSRGDADGS